MNYALWKTFLDAVELGSLSKVATLQNTNQPQISRKSADKSMNLKPYVEAGYLTGQAEVSN